MPGEIHCDWSVSVIKAHPNYQKFKQIYNGTHDNKKCQEGDIKLERVIILLRNPYDAIWSEYQRSVSHSHKEGILRTEFDREKWRNEAVIRARMYPFIWKWEYNILLSSLPEKDILLITYEQLQNPNTSIAALRQITNFLNLSKDPEPTERLQCAFQMADVDKLHRNSDISEYITADEVYTPELACEMWYILKSTMSPFGYGPWRNKSCLLGRYQSQNQTTLSANTYYNLTITNHTNDNVTLAELVMNQVNVTRTDSNNANNININLGTTETIHVLGNSPESLYLWPYRHVIQILLLVIIVATVNLCH